MGDIEVELDVRQGILHHSESREYTLDAILDSRADSKTNLAIMPMSALGRDNSSFRAGSVPLPDSNISHFALKQAKDWLRICQQTHTQCKPRQSTSSSWSQESKSIRLIQIDPSHEQTYTCRLIDHMLNKDVDYVTLSYRWTADVKKTMLSRENQRLFYQAIPTDDWPSIYRDAVSVARYLNVEYIWIDALCIVQNDSADWREQAALMNVIYERGIINVAGVMGGEADGLQIHRDPLTVYDCALSHPSGDNRVLLEEFRNPSLVDFFPLYKRGWTFQERILSTRTPHCSTQLVWGCYAGTAIESSPVPNPRYQVYVKKALAEPTILVSALTAELITKFSKLWLRLLNTFSNMDLTEPHDKLPALQGIANRLGQHLNLDPARFYVAGVWLSDCSQLWWERRSDHKWHTSDDNDMACYLSERFPSWSWAVCTEKFEIDSIGVGAFLAKFGSIPVQTGNAALPYIPSRDECISEVFLESNASSSDQKAFTGIKIQGKFINWFDTKPILELGKSDHSFDIRGYFPDPDNVSEQLFYDVNIMLDRPIMQSTQLGNLEVLPLCCDLRGSLVGIILTSCGFDLDSGMVVYRRLGYWRISWTPVSLCKRFYLNSRPREEGGMPPALERELDGIPPFKII